jgi:hypothetical protein
VVGTTVGAEQDVHERRKVGVVPGIAVAGMVPVVQLGGADQHAQGTNGKADIGVNVDRPDAAKGDEAGERFEGLDGKYFALLEKVLRPRPGMDRLP